MSQMFPLRLEIMLRQWLTFYLQLVQLGSLVSKVYQNDVLKFKKKSRDHKSGPSSTWTMIHESEFASRRFDHYQLL